MSLIFCPDCGNSVSNQADICPKCSYPIKNITKSFDNEKIDNVKIVLGYCCVFLSLFIIPIFFATCGIIYGIVNITKKEVGHGTAQIILSILCGTLGIFMGILSKLI